ncbi:hypothetical protein Aperf_G00000070874 [Anoplocephala perfoliata]
MSSGKIGKNIRKDSVYGYGDVPGNEGTRLKNRSENYLYRAEIDASGANRELVSDIKTEKIDKRKRLLDWLKASQAKRDENNRQVFSRWIERMDNMQTQTREQSLCPIFFCDYLPTPHVMYSTMDGYQDERVNNPAVFLGSPFMYQPQQEFYQPQNFEYLLKQSEQLMERSTFTDFGYYLPGFICNHELYEHTYNFKQQKKLEHDDASARLSAFGTPDALSLGAMVFPYSCAHFLPQNHDEYSATDIDENDATCGCLSDFGSGMLSLPLLYQPEYFGFLPQAPSYYPLSQPSVQLENVPFYSANDGPVYEMGVFCNQINSNIEFDVVKWNNILENITNNASFGKSEIVKQRNFPDMVQPNLKGIEKNWINEEKVGKEEKEKGINEKKKLLKVKVGNC